MAPQTTANRADPQLNKAIEKVMQALKNAKDAPAVSRPADPNQVDYTKYKTHF